MTYGYKKSWKFQFKHGMTHESAKPSSIKSGSSQQVQGGGNFSNIWESSLIADSLL